jgi:hypothetical protein
MASEQPAATPVRHDRAAVISRAWRRIWALENLDVTSLVLLGALAVASFVAGWVLRPPNGPAVQVPSSPELTINFTDAAPVRNLDIVSFLAQAAGSQTVLKVNAKGLLKPGQATTSWNMGVQGFSGAFCTPKAYRGHTAIRHVGYENYVVTGTTLSPATYQGLLLVVHLCWNHGSPLAINGPNLSAALPRVLAPDQAGTLTRVLQLHQTSLSGYSIAGGVAPTGESQSAWFWTTGLGGSFEGPGSMGVVVFGSNSSDIETENHNSFYSGILFGIAGGAALSVIPALPGLIDRRRARRSPAASEEPGRTPC